MTWQEILTIDGVTFVKQSEAEGKLTQFADQMEGAVGHDEFVDYGMNTLCTPSAPCVVCARQEGINQAKSEVREAMAKVRKGWGV